MALYRLATATVENKRPGLEVIKLEFILRLKIKRNDWLFADTCPQAANHCAVILSLSLYSSFITSRPEFHVYVNKCKFYFLLLHINKTNKGPLKL